MHHKILINWCKGLGKPKTKKSNALAIHLDQDGKVKYDTIGWFYSKCTEIWYSFEILVKQGHGKDRVVHSKFSDLVPKEILDENDASLNRPDQVCYSFLKNHYELWRNSHLQNSFY